MSGPFRRSGRFGLIGVFVVAALILVIATQTGQGEANPKTTMALIFGVLAVFVVVLLVLQRRDLERVASADARGASRAAGEGGRAVEDPTTLAEPDLWAAMTVAPIDAEAVKARSQMWEASRRSQHLGWVVMALIFLTVPAMYMLESLVPLLIGGPLIAIAAIYGSVRALMPGGELDRGYENVGRAMAPLGLAVTERPQVDIEMREATTGRVGPRVRGALVLSGERHGRPVTVRLGGDEKTGVSEGEARRRHDRVRGEIARRSGAPGRGSAADDRGRAGRGPQLDPLEEGHGRGRPRGDRRHPQGRRPGRLALRPLARRAPRRRLRQATQTTFGRLALLKTDRATAFEAWPPGVSVALGSGRARLRHPRHPLKAASFRT